MCLHIPDILEPYRIATGHAVIKSKSSHAPCVLNNETSASVSVICQTLCLERHGSGSLRSERHSTLCDLHGILLFVECLYSIWQLKLYPLVSIAGPSSFRLLDLTKASSLPLHLFSIYPFSRQVAVIIACCRPCYWHLSSSRPISHIPDLQQEHYQGLRLLNR